jgi:hypothetical protein
MDEAGFWNLIGTAKRRGKGDPFKQIEWLSASLEKLAPAEIIAFDKIFSRLKAALYRNELWAAAYVIQGGCSDDGFEYFRCWLIAQGKKVYQDALRDPETLADEIDYEEGEREEILDTVGNDMVGIAWRAYETKTGKQMPSRPVKLKLTGPAWNEDDVAALYPRLHAKFG